MLRLEKRIGNEKSLLAPKEVSLLFLCGWASTQKNSDRRSAPDLPPLRPALSPAQTPGLLFELFLHPPHSHQTGGNFFGM